MLNYWGGVNFTRGWLVSAIVFAGPLINCAYVNAANLLANAPSQENAQSSGLQINPGNWWDEAKNNPIIHLVVNKKLQDVTVFSNGKKISHSNVSTGRAGKETPGGIFSIMGKRRTHTSNIYDEAMPFMQRLTWSGIAIHESDEVPAYPASHGCVRLPGKFADNLFQFTRTGAQVIITERNVAPQRITSANLFPIGNGTVREARNSTGKKAGAAKRLRPLRVLMTRFTRRERLMEIQKLLRELRYPIGSIDGWMGPQTARAITRFQKDNKLRATGRLTKPLLGQLYKVAGKGAVKNGRIYVRRNQKPLFDVAVALKDPIVPLGTHHFTAVNDSSRMLALSQPDKYWLSMTIEQTGWPEQSEKFIFLPSNAREALSRFDLPDDLKRKIANMITPGSTVIIADEGLSHETGKGTDFIVLTK